MPTKQVGLELSPSVTKSSARPLWARQAPKGSAPPRATSSIPRWKNVTRSFNRLPGRVNPQTGMRKTTRPGM